MRRASCPAIAVVSGIVVLLLSGEISAGNPREHDGFFLRLSEGVGSATSKIDASESVELGSESVELSGGTIATNLAIGGIVTRNLALHGTLLAWNISDPDVEIDGNRLGSAEDSDLSLWAYGGGLTYYFMPANVYLSGSVGAATLSIDTPFGDFETDTGFFGEIILGKEWWVGGSWGLGVAGGAGFHSIPSGGINENWNGPSFALRFTATLN